MPLTGPNSSTTTAPPHNQRRLSPFDPPSPARRHECRKHRINQRMLTPNRTTRHSAPDPSYSDSSYSKQLRKRNHEKMSPDEQFFQHQNRLQCLKKLYPSIGSGTNSEVFLCGNKVLIYPKNPLSTADGNQTKRNHIEGVLNVSHLADMQTMDYAGQDGFDYLLAIRNHGCPHPDETTPSQSAETVNSLSRHFRETVFNDLLLSLRSLHQHGYIHRDVKSENLAYNRLTQKASFIDLGDIYNTDPCKLTGTPSTAHPIHHAYLFSNIIDQELRDLIGILSEYEDKIKTITNKRLHDENTFIQLKNTLSKLSKDDPNFDETTKALASLENILKNDFDKYRSYLSKKNKHLNEYQKLKPYQKDNLPPLTIDLWKKFDTYSLHITELSFLLSQVYKTFQKSNPTLSQAADKILTTHLNDSYNFLWKCEDIEQNINDLLQSIDKDTSETKTILSAEIQRIRTLNQLFFSVKNITDIPTAETLLPQIVTPLASSDSSETSSEDSVNSTLPAELTTTTVAEVLPSPSPLFKPGSTS